MVKVNLRKVELRKVDLMQDGELAVSELQTDTRCELSGNSGDEASDPATGHGSAGALEESQQVAQDSRVAERSQVAQDSQVAQRSQVAQGNACPGRLIVLTGPTAVGKGTVEAALRAKHPQVWVSVSATTRSPRPGEINGKTYWFMTEDEFAAKEAAGYFLETAEVHNMAHYGTPLQPVLDHVAAGIPTILEIDLQGARRVKRESARMNLDVVYVFLAPPSYDELVRRLVTRGTENEEQRRKRLQTARMELASEREFDVTIVNTTVDQAADELWAVLVKEYGLKND